MCLKVSQERRVLPSAGVTGVSPKGTSSVTDRLAASVSPRRLTEGREGTGPVCQEVFSVLKGHQVSTHRDGVTLKSSDARTGRTGAEGRCSPRPKRGRYTLLTYLFTYPPNEVEHCPVVSVDQDEDAASPSPLCPAGRPSVRE